MSRLSVAAGIPIRVSEYLPVGRAVLVDQSAFRLGMKPRFVVIRGLTFEDHLAQIWDQCRAAIARSCPTIAPPEWKSEATP